MSILMTGSVGLPEGEGGCNLDQNGRIWTGKWRFVKEKKEHDFHYRWTSDEIPLDLIQYVSFAISEPNLQLVRGRSKKKKKRKGRLPGTKLKPPKKTEQQVDKLDSEILAIDMGGVETPFRGELSVPWGMEGAAEDPFASIKSHTDSTDVTGQQDVRSELNLPEAGQSPVDQQDALKGAEEESEGGSEDGESGEEDEGESFAPRGIEKEGDAMISETTRDDTSFTVKLDTARSPLFGLWTGFFNVDPPPESATPVPVHETFFLYAFAGTPLESLPPALSSLPPEQSHSLQLLPNPRSKESARAISAPPLSPTFHCSQYAVATTANSSLHTNGSNGLHQPQAKAAEDLKEVTSCPSESTPCIPVNDGPAATSTPALSSVEVAPPAEVSLPKDATPLAVAPSSSSDHDVILGFGRNVYGRYSLMCHFDIANQSLRCEKRYMLTKQGNARRPKLKDIIGQNPSQHSSICNGDSGTHSLKRKRIPKSKFFAGILDEELMFSNGAGEDGRSYSQGPEETKRVSVGSGVGRPPTKHQTLLQQQYLPHTAFSNGDHKHFRDAFFDVLSGEIYEGDVLGLVRHGRGVCLYSDGTLYEGSWYRGLEHGKGKLMRGENREVIYSGNWFEGTISGSGVYFFPNGDKYVGEFRDGARNGFGEYLTSDGHRYVGDWLHNQRHGKGVFTWSNGSYYDGDWEGNSRHGKGVLDIVGGMRYEGGWCKNYMDGKGTAVYPGGQICQGSFRLGLREGRGSVTFVEGAVYEGRFREDRIDGQGTLQMTGVAPGAEEGERLIPVQIQADLRRIHLRAGFGDDHH